MDYLWAGIAVYVALQLNSAQVGKLLGNLSLLKEPKIDSFFVWLFQPIDFCGVEVDNCAAGFFSL